MERMTIKELILGVLGALFLFIGVFAWVLFLHAVIG